MRFESGPHEGIETSGGDWIISRSHEYLKGDSSVHNRYEETDPGQRLFEYSLIHCCAVEFFKTLVGEF
jgi:hypothetical protein